LAEHGSYQLLIFTEVKLQRFKGSRYGSRHVTRVTEGFSPPRAILAIASTPS
jgi:hypothetical protein